MADRHSSSAPQLPRQAIVVMGVSGSGKSTLGSLLSIELGCPFIEGDELHDPASVDKMRSGTPLGDADRWPWLDRLGLALDKAAARRGIAVGACSALKLAYRERLAEAIGLPVSFIMLESEPEELLRRLAKRQGHYMPASLLNSQLETLERPGPSERALILDASREPADLCMAATAWVRNEAATNNP
jgi:gluconokinase